MKARILVLLASAFLFAVSCNHNRAHSHGNESHSEDEINNEAHSGEIIFTEKQAEAAGLMTEIVKPSSFDDVLKTGGQILVPQGDEQTVVATGDGIISFTDGSLVNGKHIGRGGVIAAISAENLQNGDPTAKAKLALDAAAKEYVRAETLVRDKIISQTEFEQIRLKYETAKAEYKGAEEDTSSEGKGWPENKMPIGAASKSLDNESDLTSKGMKVSSPMNGYLKNLLVNQGDYVTVGQPVATIAQNRRLQLRADVSERYYRQLKNVRSANFKTGADDSIHKLSEMNGRLLSYGKALQEDSFYIPVTFEFDNVGDIVPGGYAEVYLLSEAKENVISVPLTALTEEQGINYVYIKIEPDAFLKREVRTGRNNGERTEILRGLKEGDEVVTKAATQVRLSAASGAIPSGHNH
ncbi:MAG: efflux RND transporter periplasmic adaptor subunit [Bacteroidales bacterium]